jgi:riboflavin kinase
VCLCCWAPLTASFSATYGFATTLIQPRAAPSLSGGRPLSDYAIDALPKSLRGQLPALCGPVSEGFGRGSRKLGIPTANLPCSLFQDQLGELPCGVYVGWAVTMHRGAQTSSPASAILLLPPLRLAVCYSVTQTAHVSQAVRGAVHRCVCNVGFSPTFVDAESPEKIVEAHLMKEFSSDFYGEPMRLLLLGFLREERKFSGVDELLATISSDIATAGEQLESSPLAELAEAPWLIAEADAEVSMVLLDPVINSDQLVPVASRTPKTTAAWDPFDGAAAPKGFTWGDLH